MYAKCKTTKIVGCPFKIIFILEAVTYTHTEKKIIVSLLIFFRPHIYNFQFNFSKNL